MFSIDSEQDPLREIFNFRNMKKSHRTKSGEYGGCSNIGVGTCS
jgi:hypothetical protein